jgi:hypothetical protein
MGKHPGGRPPIYTRSEDLEAKIEEYKHNCKLTDETPTLTGMILHIGFNSKDTFYEYGKKEEFSESIKKARLWIESLYERDLREKGHSGTIFGLKNMGWKDKIETEHSGSIGVNIIDDID